MGPSPSPQHTFNAPREEKKREQEEQWVKKAENNDKKGANDDTVCKIMFLRCQFLYKEALAQSDLLHFE